MLSSGDVCFDADLISASQKLPFIEVAIAKGQRHPHRANRAEEARVRIGPGVQRCKNENGWTRQYFRPTRRSHVFLSLLAVMTCPRPLFAIEAEPNPTITILVYNMAEAPPDILRGAERETTRIFSSAGVGINWFDCAPGHSDVGSQNVCQQGWGPVNIGLRLLAKPTASRNLQGERFGFAISPGLASAYYDYRARFISNEFGMGLPFILGCVIAHEIGHLLLGPNSHSTEGVMQAEWGQRQLRQALMRDLLFSPQQSRLIQAEVCRRMRLELAKSRAR